MTASSSVLLLLNLEVHLADRSVVSRLPSVPLVARPMIAGFLANEGSACRVTCTWLFGVAAKLSLPRKLYVDAVLLRISSSSVLVRKNPVLGSTSGNVSAFPPCVPSRGSHVDRAPLGKSLRQSVCRLVVRVTSVRLKFGANPTKYHRRSRMIGPPSSKPMSAWYALFA